jgi:murein DD-endopeptidase MepM/ murein hydrolase activator NlpD
MAAAPAVPPAAAPGMTALDAYPDTAASRPAPPAATELAAAPARTSGVDEVVVRIEKGDTIDGVLRDLDLDPDEIGRAVVALRPHLKMTDLPIGQAVTVQVRTPADSEAHPMLQALVIRPQARREITLDRDDDGAFSVREKTFETVRKHVRASGTLRGSLFGSLNDAGVPRAARSQMARAFAWDVNFQHDVKVGDRFDVLIEQSWTTDGKLVDHGRVIWARLTTGAGDKTWSVYRFRPPGGADSFYYEDGRSVVKSLLRTPLSLSRISSRFGLRRHPILGFTRMHKGIDFAAPRGTPVLAAGAGRVAQAGRTRGYGNWVKINHGRGLATGYAHMLRIARGVRAGSRVRQGQVIGFVGSTGMSTGPHLHFELHRNGKAVNPLTVARTSLRARLAGKALARFRAVVAEAKRAWAKATVLDGN